MSLCPSHQCPQSKLRGSPLQQGINVIVNIKHFSHFYLFMREKKVKFSCWKIFYWFNDQAEGLWIFSFSFLSCDPSASTPVLCAGLTWAPESSLGSGCSEQSRKKCEVLWWLLWFLLSVLQGSALFWCSVNDKYVHLVWFCREVWTVSAGTCLLV